MRQRNNGKIPFSEARISQNRPKSGYSVKLYFKKIRFSSKSSYFGQLYEIDDYEAHEFRYLSRNLGQWKLFIRQFLLGADPLVSKSEHQGRRFDPNSRRSFYNIFYFRKDVHKQEGSIATWFGRDYERIMKFLSMILRVLGLIYPYKPYHHWYLPQITCFPSFVINLIVDKQFKTIPLR